jgi:AcrR family transcriptional regulator
MENVVAQRIEAEKQERIERILNAARKLFLEKGYHGATMRDIALDAELSTGAIYVYFSGKDEIYEKVCEEAFMVVIGLIEKATCSQGMPTDRIRAIAHQYVTFYTDYFEYFEMLTFHDLGFTRRGQSEHLRERLKDLTILAVKVIEKVVIEGVEAGNFSPDLDTTRASFNLWAGLEGVLILDMMGYLRNFDLDLQTVVDTQLKILLGGIMAR